MTQSHLRWDKPKDFFEIAFTNIYIRGNHHENKLAVILLIVVFASPLAAQELTGTPEQIKKSGNVRIGYRLSEPPMSFKDPEGNPAGYTIDICKDIVTELENVIGTDVNVEYVPVNANERFKALADGFNGTRIGVVKATTTEAALKKLIQDTATTAEVVLFNSAKESIDALRKKKIDAFSSDQIVPIG